MRRTALRQRRSTHKPTKAQVLRLERITRGECICCAINRRIGYATAAFGGCDAHHLLSGGRRIGHDATIGICPWHHRGVKPYDAMTDAEASRTFGPSLAHGSRPFHDVYGSDVDLLAQQNEVLAA